MLNSIRAKVTATALAVIVVATVINAVVGGAMFTDVYASALQSRAVAIGRSLGVQLERMLTLDIQARQIAGIDQALKDAIDAHEGVAGIAVLGADGETAFWVDHGTPIPRPDVADITRALESRTPVLLSPAPRHGNYFHAIVPLEGSGGSKAIVVSIRRQMIAEGLAGLGTSWLVFGLVGVVAATALLWLTGGILIDRPLGRLLSAIRTVAAGDAAAACRVPVTSSDEVGVIGRAFNAMLDDVAAAQAALCEKSEELERRLQELLEFHGLEQRFQEVVDSRALLARQAEELSVLAGDLAEARDAAEAANRAKTQFLATMSHEIRTPMNGVLGMIDLLLDDTLTDGQRHLAQTARESADTLLTVIDDILDYSKLEADSVELEVVDFALDRVIGQVARLLGPRARAKGLELDYRIAEDLPPALRGDPNRLRQILFNLVGNAVKFTDTGGVAIEAERQAGSDGSLQVLIKVRDTGCGIPAAVKDKLFTRFTQADSSMTRRYGGTGLGLAISKQLVRLMGGEIGVDSVEGVGSTFRFSFGAEPGTATAPMPASAPEAQPRAASAPRIGMRILVAEDNAVNQELVRILLERAGHSVTVVENGADAVAAVRDDGFDLVLMDAQMPLMDGAEATRVIRALDGPASAVPIVALTANVMPDAETNCLASGMDAYVSKPIDPRRLLGTIAALAARDEAGRRIEGDAA